MAKMSLSGWVCVVTDASRGMGRAIALKMFEAGATVYIIERGNCVPVVCDSTKDEDIEQLFEQLKREQNGRLDILVNNVYAEIQVHTAMTFWETDQSIWDSINNTGLRYVFVLSQVCLLSQQATSCPRVC
uniref:Uncharacterized protein n=1 Tax=Anabas testudineus TaxID=64144 RepID=A0A3Q1HS41_ANATE